MYQETWCSKNLRPGFEYLQKEEIWNFRTSGGVQFVIQHLTLTLSGFDILNWDDKRFRARILICCSWEIDSRKFLRTFSQILSDSMVVKLRWVLTDTGENVQKWTRVFSTRRWVILVVQTRRKKVENSVVALRSLLNVFAWGQVSSPRLYRLT